MTNTEPVQPKNALKPRLEQASTHCTLIALAAEACVATFSWLHLHRKFLLTMLDADVMCGALTSLNLFRLLSFAEETGFDSPIESLIGLHTLRFHLSHVDQYYIPPGAAAELLQQQRRLTGHLTEDAVRFLRTVEKAGRAEDPIAFIRQGASVTDTAAKVLYDNLSRLASGFEERSFLTSALDKCISIGDFELRGSNLTPGKVFHRTYRYLEGLRKLPRDANNVNDAINMELVAQLSANDGRCQGTAIVPRLITDTQPIVNFAPNIMPLVTSRRDYPRVVGKYTDLMVTQGLRLRTEDRYEMAAHEAGLLRTQAHEVDAQLQHLLRQIQNYNNEDEAIEHISNDEWELLSLKADGLHKDWPDVFGPSSQCASKDRAQYLNRLMSPEVVCQLESNSADSVREGVLELRNRLRAVKDPVYILRQIAEEGRVAITSHSGSHPLGKTTTIQCLVNQGQPLSTLRPSEKDAIHPDVDRLRSLHDLRFVAHCTQISEGGLVSLDSWCHSQSPRDRSCAFIWPHEEDASSLIDQGAELLQRACALGQEETFQYRFVGGERAARGWARYADARTSLLSKVKSGCPKVEYFELWSPTVTFFADVHEQQGSEKQIGLMLKGASMKAAPLHVLAECVHRTSLYPLDSEYYHHVLKQLASKAFLFLILET